MCGCLIINLLLKKVFWQHKRKTRDSFSTTTFWSLSVQSFIAPESRLLIPFLFPLFSFFHAPLSQQLCFSQHTRRNSSQPLYRCYGHLRDIVWTLKIHSLLAMHAAMSLRCRCRSSCTGAVRSMCSAIFLRSCFFTVALCVAEAQRSTFAFRLCVQKLQLCYLFPPLRLQEIANCANAGCSMYSDLRCFQRHK